MLFYLFKFLNWWIDDKFVRKIFLVVFWMFGRKKSGTQVGKHFKQKTNSWHSSDKKYLTKQFEKFWGKCSKFKFLFGFDVIVLNFCFGVDIYGFFMVMHRPLNQKQIKSIFLSLLSPFFSLSFSLIKLLRYFFLFLRLTKKMVLQML